MSKKVVLKSYDEISQRRKVLRKRFIFASIPFVLLIAIFTGQVSFMYYNGWQSQKLYEEGQYEKALAYTEKQKSTPIFEEWLAYYNAGVIKYKMGEYLGAIQELETALEIVAPTGNQERECRIRLVLAESYNLHGDQNADGNDNIEAERYYKRAIQIAEQAPEMCTPPPPSPPSGEGDDTEEENLPDEKEGDSGNGSPGEELGAIRDDAQEKIDAMQPEEAPEGEPASPETNDEGEGEQGGRDSIQEQLDENQQDQTQGQQSNEDPLGSPNFSEPNSKPW